MADIKTRQLDFNLAGSESGSANWAKSTIGVMSKSNDFNYAGNLTANYSFIRNSDKYQGEMEARISGIANKYNDYFGVHFSMNPILSINSINRCYIRPKFFLEYDLNLWGNLINKVDKPTDGRTKVNYSHYMDVGVPILIGTGRIDPVQDARLAVYILQDLKKASGLSRIPDQTEIIEFARLISQVKSKRIFDAREKLIWEMETIDKFLKSKNILPTEDAAYFTRLYDNWLYASGPVRESGRRLSAGLVPMLNFSRYYNYTDSIIKQPGRNSLMLKALVRQERTKPVNLCWQTGHMVELSAMFGKENNNPITSPNTEDPIRTIITGTFEYMLGWYPNSRTSATVNTGIVTGYYTLIPKPSERLDLYLYPTLKLRFNYYFSPQLTIRTNYELLYCFSGSSWPIPLWPFHQSSVQQGLNHSFSLSLFYSLF